MASEFDNLAAGTEWRRCALQVNPLSYLEANGKSLDGLDNESSYNAAIVAALVHAGISVIAITDHWSVDSGADLRIAAEVAGLTVFPGFEATAKDGVHLLVLFDPASDTANINRNIGECGIPADCRDARPGSLDTLELLECAEKWGAVTVAPHVTTGGGLLDKLSGQSAVRAWTDARLHAVGVGGATPSQANAAILANKDPAYRRGNPLAVLSAADISSPADAAKAGSSCWIKLSSLTISGLDLAFRTPETRVARTDPTESTHARIVGIGWEGGFLDGVTIRLNESLNVLIGGRGSGKSTVVESLRYALGIAPLAKSSIDEHDSMVNNVLGAGTKIRLEIQVRVPAPAIYTIERLIGSKPVVRESTGALLHSVPSDLLRGTEVYGQRELAELARDKQRLTSLLAQYLPDGADHSEAAVGQFRDIERSRRDILALREDVETLDGRLARMPVVKERLARFDEAGVGTKLQDQERTQQEQQLLSRASSSIQETPDLVDALIVETDYLVGEEVAELPNAEVLSRAKSFLDNYNAAVTAAMSELTAARQKTEADLKALQAEWEGETEQVRGALEKVLRALQPDGIDGDEYLRLRRELGSLTPLTGKRAARQAELDQLITDREGLLIEAEDRRASRLRDLQKEAKKVGRNLPGIVKASVRDGDDRTALTSLLDNRISGRLDRVRAALNDTELLSPRAFVQACRNGGDAIIAAYPTITPAQALLLAGASEETLMLAEEIDLPISTDLQLNVGTKESYTWRNLDHLSTGQKATALLLLLMHRGDGPLIIDQPEDDLDNRFIYEDIVPRLRATKGKRQVIFSSHNANIPVLGDADQIVSLVAEDGSNGVSGRIIDDGLGSIDHPPVRAMVEELLEGGREAFNTRRYLYGF
ncbi:TrlF family AAA-like ATPase [Kribbella lupini]|uniref:AAA family ATPase n=1 Tax=Kribbella lupini TaxID=291602 RepID=A0ABP4KXG8_9ACTN